MELDDTCSICQNTIKTTESITTPCKHRFCSDCFFTWMKRKANCPVCRNEFVNTSDAERRRVAELVEASRQWEEYLDDLKDSCTPLETRLNNLCGEIVNHEKKQEELERILLQINEECSKKRIIIMKEKEEWEVGQRQRAAYLQEWRNRSLQQQTQKNAQRNAQRNRFGLNF